jgi:hypothetical protein
MRSTRELEVSFTCTPPTSRRGAEGVLQPVGEDAGGESVGRGVHARDRLVERIEGHDAHQRPEHFLAAHFHAVVDAGKERRRDRGTLARAAGEPLRAPRHRLLDPGLHADRLLLADQGAHKGVRIARVAVLERLHLLRELALDLAGDRAVREQELHRGAHLPRLAIARVHHLGQRRVESCVVAQDGEGDRAELHLRAAQAGARLDAAADLGAAGEGEEAHALVGDQPLGHLRAARDHREESGGHTGLEQHLGEPERRERRGGRGLQDHGVARGERGRDLVRDRVERRVERRDREHHAQRHAQREAHAARLLRRARERDHLAREPPRLLRGELQGLHAAAHFAAGIGGGEARLHLHRAHERVLALLDEGRRALQDRAALERPRRPAPERGVRGVHGAPRLPLVGRRDLRAGLQAELVHHGERRPLAGGPLAVEEQRLHGHSHRIFFR